MATTVHLMQRAPVAVVPSGIFGRRVAEIIMQAAPGVRTTAEDAVNAGFASAVSVVIVALSRPRSALCESADAQSFAEGRPWLPVVMQQRRILIGPLVVPPDGPCYQCLTRRLDQHDYRPGERAALEAAYDRGAPFSPAGFLPQHARLAAGLAMELVSALSAPDAPGSDPADRLVVSVHLPRCAVTTAWVIPCHDCSRCPGPGPEYRGVSRIRDALQQVQRERVRVP